MYYISPAATPNMRNVFLDSFPPSDDLKRALGIVLGGGKVAIYGPAGSGKTLIMRRLARFLVKSDYASPIYIEVSSARAGWGLEEYVEYYWAEKYLDVATYDEWGRRYRDPDPVYLVDDAELMFVFPSLYGRLLRDVMSVRERAVAVSFTVPLSTGAAGDVARLVEGFAEMWLGGPDTGARGGTPIYMKLPFMRRLLGRSIDVELEVY